MTTLPEEPAKPDLPQVIDGPLLPALGQRPRRSLVRALAGKAISARKAVAARNVDSEGVAPRTGWRFMLRHPAHFIALGAGTGLSPIAPGTAATLWAWVAFLVINPAMSDAGWAQTIAIGALLGWWASKVTARNLGQGDPGSIVIDEIIAFWAVLWLVMPAGFWGQVAAFALFRYFDAAKPGPVGWADRAFKVAQPGSWRGGLGVMLDDFVAAACAVLVVALWRAW